MILEIISLGYFFKIAIIIVIGIYLFSVNIGPQKNNPKSYKSQSKGFFSAFKKSSNALTIDKTVELLRNENINVPVIGNRSMPASEAANKQQQ